MTKTIRIFISSPGDVAEERERARQVVEQLRRRYAGRLRLRAVLWEELPLQADMSFQQGIDMVLGEDQGIDVAVFILWSRLGSPLGTLIRKPDGTEYRSGTEREFDLVLQARRRAVELVERGEMAEVRPSILVYTRADDTSFDERLRGKSTKDKDALISQKKLVEEFIQEEFHDSERGTNIRAYHTFPGPSLFSQRLRVHLQGLLDGIAGDMEGPPVWDIAKKGPPFLGLDAFQPEHADVFFGREDEILDVRHALREQARNGCAFVLVSGPSGSGKSSLVRAGVLPTITRYEIDETVVAWRRAVVSPGQIVGDPVRGLARVLMQDSALPELRGDDEALDDLALGLRKDPEVTVRLRFKPAFQSTCRQARGAVRLLLLVDQFEELFTDQRLDDADRTAFVNVLDALARSGSVWVMATVRSDFYGHCERLPVLMAMKGTAGQYSVQPPRADALQRLIAEPARQAGLIFQERGGKRLDSVILAEASRHAELLPLLEHLLLELYRERTDNNELTFAAFEAMGGVEGAIAARADDTYDALTPEQQAVFPEVMDALVTLSGDQDESPVRRHPVLTEVADTPARKALVDAFVAARLFTSAREDASGEATASVAHETLLRVWPRARDWIDRNRDFLRVRAQIDQRMAQGGILVPEDPLYDRAKAELARSRDRFTPRQAAYIETAIAAAERKQRRTRRIRRTAMVCFSVLALFSAGLAVFAWRQKERAIGERDRANASDRKIRIQSALSDFLIASEKVDQERPDIALAYLARAIDRDPGNLAARARLSSLIRSRRWMLIVDASDPPQTSDMRGVAWDMVAESSDTSFIPEGQWTPLSLDSKRSCLVAASGDTACVWDLTRKEQKFRLPHEYTVCCADFSPSGRWLATACGDFLEGSGNVRIWDMEDGTPRGREIPLHALPSSVEFSPDEQLIAISEDNGRARIWNVANTRPYSSVLEHELRVESVAFSPDSQRVVTGSDDGTACVWRITGERTSNQLMRHEKWIRSVGFSPDGRWVVTASWDHTARVWDSQSGVPICEPMRHQQPVLSAEFSADGRSISTRTTSGREVVWQLARTWPFQASIEHRSWAMKPHFNPQGHRVVTAQSLNSAIVWDTMAAKPASRPMEHKGCIRSARFSLDGGLVVTASEDRTARLWDADTGELRSVPLRHEKDVLFADFSPDACRVVTVASDNVVRIWDTAEGALVHDSVQLGGEVTCVRFSPDGSRIVTSSRDCSARVWSAVTGEPVSDPMRHGSDVLSALFSPDGRLVATASAEGDCTARVWDAATGEPISRPMKHYRGVCVAAFSPDGNRVVTASADGTCRVWDSLTGKAITEPMRHDHTVNSASFDPEGRWIVTGSMDGTARVWDASTGCPISAPLRAWRFHDAVSAEFSSDGKWIMVSAMEGGVCVREAVPGARWTGLDTTLAGKVACVVSGLQFNAETSVIEQLDPGKVVRERKELALRINDPVLGVLIQSVVLPRTDLPVLLCQKARTVGENLREHPGALFEAALEDNLPKMADCIDAGVDVCARDAEGRSALFLVADNPGIVRYLVRCYEGAAGRLHSRAASRAKLELAHAYLFNDQFEKARAIYAQYLNTAFEDGRKWNDELRNDFRLLREAGHDHSAMARIEELLGLGKKE